jgi:voltage-gated potassium channel
LKAPAALAKVAALRQPLRRIWLRVYRFARLDLWFPHVPLALAVGIAGALALLPTVEDYLQEYLHLQLNGLFDSLHPLAAGVPELILRGVPSAIIGLLQIFIAVGLLGRSRLAWFAALLITFAQGTLAIFYSHQHWFSVPVLYVSILFIALVAARYSFQRSSLAAGTLFAIAATVILLSYGVLGSLILGQGFAPPIVSLPQAMYFTVVTMSTVGYGDILPKSDDARLFVISLIVLGISVFVTSFTAVVGPIVQSRISRIIEPRRKRMKRVNHFIITGEGALAHNTARELLARDKSVVMIVDDDDKSFGDADIVIGDATDLEILRLAGATTADSVLALSDDDAENAFVILALRELNTEAKKIAAVSSRKNLERVRRVQPDMILAPNVFGGEVLAMALTEEKIDGESLLKRFLDVKPQQS